MSTQTKARRVPSRAIRGRTDLVAAEENDGSRAPNERSAGVAAPVIASFNVSATTARYPRNGTTASSPVIAAQTTACGAPATA